MELELLPLVARRQLDTPRTLRGTQQHVTKDGWKYMEPVVHNNR